MADRTPRQILVDTRDAGARAQVRIREQIARLTKDLARCEKQGVWLDLWRYDEARGAFVTERGDMIAEVVVEADGSGWPFIEAWYKAYPEERSIP